MSLLPEHLIQKILTYNIHPNAEFLKYIFNDPEFQGIDSFFISEWCNIACWKCHDIIKGRWVIIACKNYCLPCNLKLNFSDDEVHYSAIKLLEREILRKQNNIYPRRIMANWGCALYTKNNIKHKSS